ncbi:MULTISPECIES: hypothetical protein [Capnocytophaga]|uniref:Ribonuclease Z n=1 Tax=Capnocytophaga canis TaxID=1848903 RepID=A0A0B7IAH4_9FLAO|nr:MULTISPECIES: hypothetical protein [Capnocytophaga]ATA73330.1 ribonuclease Z [Capnocytophaga sp. H4358]ATA75479.1 ribonuclease Z [Capnocytophaga sp. H2931]CEN47679.1 Ribonuclease Z [Capnocytophaga canis]CEN53599.1 Ribonuclease Z [Capnocytophaga canis]GIM60504.1 hypothetical protein CAPN008_05540 [Capnocytophaga canis]
MSTKIITIKKSELSDFVNTFKDKEELKSTHIILDLSEIKDLETKDLIPFVEISKYHTKKNKKSLVIVSEEITYGNIPNEINLTPTIQEAKDVIEIEDIQRDLGF